MNSKDKTPIILYLGEFNNQLEAEIVVKEKREPYYSSNEESPAMIRRAYFQSEHYRSYAFTNSHPVLIGKFSYVTQSLELPT